ncbi:MAG: vWA domain-containing protein [Verrucomicrobiales bacterium]|nr:VWA domain-containing protein [Verrucomicrobiota bacterium JB025]
MKTTTLILASALLSALPLAAKTTDQPPVDPPQDKVQIALLLDTSNSMDGLIDQAKTQLWKIVNTFIDARKNGAAPFVEVALYEYGNNNQHVGNHYIRQVQPLSRDLDELSARLFALTTNGGDEYCGAVIQRALADLSWDAKPGTYKAIFIAGNEPFTQGPVDPRQACRDGRSKGIVINTIHCGDRDAGISGSWHDGAALSGGKFLTINQDKAVRHIDAPQDKEITDLGIQLNKTYLGYGTQREKAMESQNSADHAAALNAQSGAHVQRSISKASTNYHNANWDLVDAVNDHQIDLETIEKSQLPPELQALTAEQLKQRVEQAAKTRAQLQTRIQQLNKARQAHIAREQAKQADSNDQTLDQAIVNATREQATALGYTFGN